MKKGLSVNLPNQADMKGGRIVEHHQTIGLEVQAGDVIVTVQIHDRTLQFKAPSLGKLVSIAPMGTLPEPGDLLFRLIVEEQSESDTKKGTSKADNDYSSDTHGEGVQVETEPDQKQHRAKRASSNESNDEGHSTSQNSGGWRKVISSARTGFGLLIWLLVGSVLAGVYSLATEGNSPIGGWIPANRITVFDGAFELMSDLQISWIRSRQEARYEELKAKSAKEKAANADKVDAKNERNTNGINSGEINNAETYQENVRRCSMRDKACEPNVHVLCQLKIGPHSGDDRWRNPIKSYMCAPQPVSFSNGMWRQGYADGSKACQINFGDNAFLLSSFSRNSGFTSKTEYQSDNPAQACVDACENEASKFKKSCTGLAPK